MKKGDIYEVVYGDSISLGEGIRCIESNGSRLRCYLAPGTKLVIWRDVSPDDVTVHVSIWGVPHEIHWSWFQEEFLKKIE